MWCGWWEYALDDSVENQNVVQMKSVFTYPSNRSVCYSQLPLITMTGNRKLFYCVNGSITITARIRYLLSFAKVARKLQILDPYSPILGFEQGSLWPCLYTRVVQRWTVLPLLLQLPFVFLQNHPLYLSKKTGNCLKHFN